MKIKPNPTLPPLGKKVLLKCVSHDSWDYDDENPKEYPETFLGYRVPGEKGGYFYLIPDLPQKRERYEVVAWQEVPEF